MIAYVLGNGPTLPVDALEQLDGEFTVGVNAILRSGFCPKVLFWFDSFENPIHAERFAGVLDGIKASPAIRVSVDKSWGRPHCHCALRKASRRDPNTPETMHVHGSSGAAAVRWCLALGFDRVAMLGMSGTFDGAKTNFYAEQNRAENKPDRPIHDCRTQFRAELVHLAATYPGRTFHADDPSEWKADGLWSREMARDFVARKCAGVAV